MPIPANVLNRKPQRSQGFAFRTRVRTIGTCNWLCPNCGGITRTRLFRTTWKLKCSVKTCGITFGLGYKLWQLPLGPHQQPLDVTFPLADLGVLPAVGGRLHEAVQPPESD